MVLESSYYDSSVSGDYDYNLIEPTGIDTDKDNNVWVSYSNSLSGFVLKYNSTGNVLYSLAAPLCSTPQEIVTDKDGNVWICYSGLNWNTLGKIEKRSSNGTLLRAITGLRNPNYLTLDTNQNLWFSYAFHNIGTINTRTGTYFQYTVKGQDLKPNDFPKKIAHLIPKKAQNHGLTFYKIQMKQQLKVLRVICEGICILSIRLKIKFMFLIQRQEKQ